MMPGTLLHRSPVNYGLMALGILTVFYLNTADVRLVFRPPEIATSPTPVENGHEY